MYILCYLFVTSIRCYSLLYSWFRNTNDAACNFWLVSSSTKYLIVGSLIVSGLRKFAKKGWKVSKVAKKVAPRKEYLANFSNKNIFL